jgi:hypothetical protein
MSEDQAAIAAIVEARDKLQLLRGAAFDATAVLDRIDGARRQMSVADDEFRHQIENTKERVRWLISELDKLTAKLRSLK